MSCPTPINIWTIMLDGNIYPFGHGGYLNENIYRLYKFKGMGSYTATLTVPLQTPCERSCGCPPGGGWGCAGLAAGTRTWSGSESAFMTSTKDTSVTSNGNFLETESIKIQNKYNYDDNGKSHVASKNDLIKLVNGAEMDGSEHFCMPEVYRPDVQCGETPPDCVVTCYDFGYWDGGCANGLGGLPGYVDDYICEEPTDETYGKCKGTRSYTSGGENGCGYHSYKEMKVDGVKLSSIISPQTSFQILEQAVDTKLLKKYENNPIDYDGISPIETNVCYTYTLLCEGEETPHTFSTDNEDYEPSDECEIIEMSTHPHTCGCSGDKDACWGGFGDGLTIAENTNYHIQYGKFKVSINKEYFENNFKKITGRVYFYKPLQDEHKTPCCSDNFPVENILAQSSFNFEGTSNTFKSTDTALDLDFIYKNSNYPSYAGQQMKACVLIIDSK